MGAHRESTIGIMDAYVAISKCLTVVTRFVSRNYFLFMTPLLVKTLSVRCTSKLSEEADVYMVWRRARLSALAKTPHATLNNPANFSLSSTCCDILGCTQIKGQSIVNN